MALFVGTTLGPVATAAGIEEKTREWVLHRLQSDLRSTPDMDRFSSLLMGLVSDYRGSHYPETRRLLEHIARFLRRLDTGRLNCAQLLDARMTVHFVRLAGFDVATAKLDKRLEACDFKANPFDLAVALFYYCRFTDQDPQQRIPGGIERLEAYQRPDGGFAAVPPPWGYYLSSHATLALYFCRGKPTVVRRGQQYLLHSLAYFKRLGFIDGLLESLLMLDMMAVPVPDHASYVSYILSRVRSDGGICKLDRPGCSSDWHATGLLLEWQRRLPAAKPLGANPHHQETGRDSVRRGL